MSMRDGSLRAWRLGFDHGTIWLGSAFVTNGGVAAYNLFSSPKIPHGSVERTKAKLRRGEPVRVLVTGGSMVYGAVADTTNRWVRLLWDARCANTNFIVPGASNVVVLDRSVGSQLMRGHFALLRATLSAEPATQSVAQEGAFTNFPAPFYESKPPLVPIDLALVCGTFNDTPREFPEDKFAFCENLVRRLRAAGVEVILNDDQSSVVASDGRWDERPLLADLAERTGSAFADTASAMDFGLKTGAKVYGDVVHESQLGNSVWADCFRSILNDFPLEPSTNGLSSERVFRWPEERWNIDGPAFADIQFSPDSATGLIGATSQRDFFNPAIWAGGKVRTNSQIALAVGTWAEFSHLAPMALDLVLDAVDSFTVEITDANTGAVMRTLPVGKEGTTPKIIPALTQSDVDNLVKTNGNYRVRITCVVGAGEFTNTARFLGVAWLTRRDVSVSSFEVRTGGISLRGEPGEPFRIQTSSDLSSWSKPFVATPRKSGVVTVDAVDPQDMRFYRAFWGDSFR
jgi:hypothetical protein